MLQLWRLDLSWLLRWSDVVPSISGLFKWQFEPEVILLRLVFALLASSSVRQSRTRMRILGHRQRDIDVGTTRLDYPRLRERRQVIRRIDTVEKLERVHPSNNVLKALDVVCAQYLDKSVETLKADRSNLVNHDAVSGPVACHLEPEWPWPDPAR